MRRTVFTLLLCMLLGIVITAQEGETPVIFPIDDWQSENPESHGLNPEILSEMDEYIASDAERLASLLIIRDGVLVYEQYFDGGDADTLRPVFSVTKSITSALTGIALENGDLERVDTLVLDYFPDYVPDDDRKAVLTLEHLLQMQSGILWSDTSQAVPLLRGETSSQDIIALPLATEPGEYWSYSTGNSQLIAYLLTESTGIPLADYADEHLFEPLGIESYLWPTDADDIYLGGVGLEMRARDMAKFGYLYLQNGLWDGEQLIPTDWITASTTPYNKRQDYGYHWWIETFDDVSGYAAQGFGGQSVYVFPSLDLIVVMQSNPGLFGMQRHTDTIVGDYVLKALED